MRIIILLILTALTAQSGRGATEAEFTAKVFGTAENLAIVKNAQKVTACILTPKGDPDHPEEWKSEDLMNPGTYKRGPRMDVPAAQLAELRAILFDRTLDDPDSSKACIPILHVRFTFTAGKSSLDIDLCFLCDLLWVSRAGKIIGGEDFDPAHGKLLALCQVLFPNDQALSHLAKR